MKLTVLDLLLSLHILRVILKEWCSTGTAMKQGLVKQVDLVVSLTGMRKEFSYGTVETLCQTHRNNVLQWWARNLNVSIPLCSFCYE